jgi:hypothetical protein
MRTSSDSTQSLFEASLVDFLTTTYLLQMEYIIKLVDVCTLWKAWSSSDSQVSVATQVDH